MSEDGEKRKGCCACFGRKKTADDAVVAVDAAATDLPKQRTSMMGFMSRGASGKNQPPPGSADKNAATSNKQQQKV